VDDPVDHLLGGRVAGEILQTAIEDDDFVCPPDGVLEDLALVLPAG